MTAVRVGGSFHWQVPVNKMSWMGRSFSLVNRFALTDTGTTFMVMPEEDWANLYQTVCDLYASTIDCRSVESYRLLYAPGIASMRFQPFEI